jgi:hypothetical protein
MALLPLVITLTGCKTTGQKIDQLISKGDYLAAAHKAVDAIKDDKTNLKIQELLTQSGESIFQKAYQKGIFLEETPGQHLKAIQYWDSFIMVTQEMLLQDIPIRNLDKMSENAKTRRVNFVQKVVELEYQKGLLDYNNGQFKDSVWHFRTLSHYQEDYKDVADLLPKAVQKATKKISIHPFVSQRELIAEDINITQLVNTLILENLNDTKDEFLVVTLDYDTEAAQDSDYYMNGMITAHVKDNPRPKLYRTETGIIQYTELVNGGSQSNNYQFTYPIFEKAYTVTLTINAKVYTKKTNAKIGTISFKTIVNRPTYHRGNPSSMPKNAVYVQLPSDYWDLPNEPQMIDKEAVIKDAALKASKQLSIELLKML